MNITRAEADADNSEPTGSLGSLLPENAKVGVPDRLKPAAISVIAWAGGAAAAKLRRRNPPWLLWSFLLVVMVPTACAAFYLGVWASPRYTSEFRTAVRSSGGSGMGNITSLLGLSGMSQVGNDSNAVVQYLQSHDAVAALDETQGLRSQYSAKTIDYWSRLKDNATNESLLRYWQGMIDAYFESTTSTIVVRISAFSPQNAQAFAKSALATAEALVNQLSTRARNDAVSYAQDEVTKSEARLNEVNDRLMALRDKDKILDARKAAESVLTIATKLKDHIGNLRASLATQLSTLSANAPSVVAMRQTIDGLQGELDRVNAEITTSPGSNGKSLSGVLGAFDAMENQRLFAERAYQSALAALEGARVEAGRQQVYLATIVTPNLPQDPSYPRPWRGTASAFGIAMAIWSILILATSAVRQHL